MSIGAAVLVVDPDRRRRRHLARLLRGECEVVTCADLDEAAWRFADLKPQVALIRLASPESALLPARLRHLSGGRRAALVLYGPIPRGLQRDLTASQPSRARWRFDVLFDRDLREDDVGFIAREAQRRAVNIPAAQPEPIDEDMPTLPPNAEDGFQQPGLFSRLWASLG